MPEADSPRSRLCLVTPHDLDPDDAVRRIGDALAGGDVASLILDGEGEHLQRLAEAVTPAAQARGVAVIIRNDSRIAGRAKADGVHVDTGIGDIAAAAERLRPKLIVGAGGFTTRHEAMVAGETDPDYLFFGRLDGDNAAGIFPKALDLAAWWSSVFIIPAIVMGGRSLASVEEAARAGVAFVALSRAVLDDERGAAAAVEEANRRLAEAARATA